MKIEFSVDGKDAPFLMHRMCEETGIPAPKEVLNDFACEIRRARGAFVHLYDSLLFQTPADATEALTQASIDMLVRVELAVRNFIMFCFMMFWPLETSVYMKISPSDSAVHMLVTSEKHSTPSGFQRLI
jgi:hypothetical protein